MRNPTKMNHLATSLRTLAPIASVFFCLRSSNASVWAQTDPGALTPQLHARLTSMETLGPGDQVELAVSFCPELSKAFRVSENGTLDLPLLQEPLAVSGKTPTQVGRMLSAALVREHLLAEPVVTVSVLEYRSRPVSVVGAVNHPITFQATDRTTLIEALAMAGGLSPTAGSNLIITGSSSDGSRQTAHSVPVKDLMNGDVPAADLALHGGEEIRVLEANKIFIAGNVHKPGMYTMQSDADTTVLKAVALSSGLDSYSCKVAYIYRKRAVGSERDEVKVELQQIMKRRSPDVALLPDDILYVPTADGKKLTGKILGEIAGFGQTAEAGLLVAR